MKIIYVTGNQKKFEVAKIGLKGVGIKLVQQSLSVPEIQGSTVEEVSQFKATFARDTLNIPVVVTDGGFSFRALNGFPGPYMKYINQWLTAEDIIRLMEGKSDRFVEAIECLTYCEPGNEPVSFISKLSGMIAIKPGKKGWTSFNEVFIPEGYDKVSSEIPDEEMYKFWGKGLNWDKFKDYILKGITSKKNGNDKEP
jgi:XTP/dITP diphosphohydrolase